MFTKHEEKIDSIAEQLAQEGHESGLGRRRFQNANLGRRHIFAQRKNRRF